MYFMKKSLVIGVILLAAGCRVTTEPPGPGPDTNVAGLKAIRTCEELTSYLEAKLEDPVAVYDGVGAPTAAPDSPIAEDAQETTVEEADIVKQEGNRLYIANSQAGLLVYDKSDASHPSLLGQVDLDTSPLELYVQGTKIVLIAYDRVDVLDLSNPGTPVTLRQYDLDGSYSNSRKVGTSVYVVSQAGISNYNLEEAVSRRSPCNPVYVPEAMDEEEDVYSFTSWEIYGIDLEGLGEPERVSLLSSSGSDITATPNHFYLTDLFWETDQTGIYLFELDSSAAGITPKATASVPGRIVDQFSMDETDGVFRIATTTNRSTFGADDNRNYLTTFRAADGSLTQLGRIDSITPGESITAARFVGTTAFLTTYVTKDPLLAVDLSNPAEPAVLGELELPGYASYLYPYGDLLIAIGSEMEFGGNVLLNLFDVSDLSSPRLVEQETIADSWSSEAQYEHRAFSFFEDRGLLAIPVSTEGGSEIQVFSVNQSGLTQIAAINHDDLIDGDDYNPVMRRSLENGNWLYTVSEAGLKVSSFGTFQEVFGEMFPGFEPPDWGYCGCEGDICYDCFAEPL